MTKSALHTLDRVTASHHRLHPVPAPVQILRIFQGGPKDTYVKVRYPDGQVILNHHGTVNMAHGPASEVLRHVAHVEHLLTELAQRKAAKAG